MNAADWRDGALFGRGKERGTVETLVGAGTLVQGKVRASRSLRVDGRIDGEVEVEGDVMVGEKGVIAASVTARNAFIAGEVRGDVRVAGRVELAATARLHGDIWCRELSVARGAVFQGACNMTAQAEAGGDAAATAMADGV